MNMLTMWVFHALTAIICSFDLEARYWNAVNIFLNSWLDSDKHIYTYMSEDFKTRDKIWFLLHALYELSCFSFLWFKELSLSLKDLDFTFILDKSCCLTNDQIIIFFYINDIILIFYQHNNEKFETLKTHLFTKYEFHDQKELKWFLNIQIICDRQAWKLYLIQDVYINKIIQWFDLQTASHIYKFLFRNVLQFMLYDKWAISNEIQAYQEHIDLLIYSINILYIDIAHSTSLLACFIQNSFLIHAIKADHLIIYLHDYKWLSLVMNDNTDLSDESIKIFEDSNDTSYSDNLTMCQSSERYIFYLFDCSIDWQTI